MKKFIFISPHQPPEKLKKDTYEAVDNDNLKYNIPTGFPIMNVINGYTEENDEINIISVISDYDNAKKNFETFKTEIDNFKKIKNLKVNISEIIIPYSEEIDVQLEIFSKLIDCTADNDELFCDITYGTKIMSQVLTMSLNYGYRIHNDVTLGCIVYGGVNHNTKKMKIYDITSLNYMDEIVRMFAENKVPNPTEKIKNMLK